jgi:hypothetical protein
LIVHFAPGIRISKEEKDAWHKDVNVRFQPKAWYDEEMCEEYARVEFKEITAEARKAGRESVAIFDNLSGQTTEQHLKNLAANKCKRHLLPAGMTDELQLIDDGVGYALKNEMGKLHDDWLIEDGNLELWTAEGKDFPMWKKRVLITQLAAQAWENICARFDFEKAATRLGMRMTIDGSGDQFICVQGADKYSFTDVDGGEPGKESDQEEGQAEESDVPPIDSSDAEEDAEEEEEDAEEEAEVPQDEEEGEEGKEGDAEGGLTDSSEENDDTAGSVANNIGSAKAPGGWKIITEVPPLDTQLERQQLIGKMVLYGHDSKQASGWFLGTVQSSTVPPRDLKKTPTANFVVEYHAKMTDKKLVGKVSCELSARTYGTTEWWVLVEKENAEAAGPSSAGPSSAAERGRGGRGRGRGREARA